MYCPAKLKPIKHAQHSSDERSTPSHQSDFNFMIITTTTTTKETIFWSSDVLSSLDASWQGFLPEKMTARRFSGVPFHIHPGRYGSHGSRASAKKKFSCLVRTSGQPLTHWRLRLQRKLSIYEGIVQNKEGGEPLACSWLSAKTGSNIGQNGMLMGTAYISELRALKKAKCWSNRLLRGFFWLKLSPLVTSGA